MVQGITEDHNGIETVLKYLKRYWRIRNGKYGKHLRPTIHFILKKLRQRVPKGQWRWRILEERV
jgi:peptidyl-tRNA hydrolase